jgi:hypothetical protein
VREIVAGILVLGLAVVAFACIEIMDDVYHRRGPDE